MNFQTKNTNDTTGVLLTKYFSNIVASSPPGKTPKIGERQSATLLVRALAEGVVDGPLEWKKYGLDRKDRRTGYHRYLEWRRNNGKTFQTHLDLSNFLVYRYHDTFSRVVVSDKKLVWNLVGQKDKPILLILKDSDRQLFPGEQDRIQKLIPSDLDYHQIQYISGDQKDGHLVNIKTTGGGKETINHYFHTYQFHEKNIYPPMITECSLTKIWASQKLITLIKKLIPDNGYTLDQKIEKIPVLVKNTNHSQKWILEQLAGIYFCSVDPEYHTKPDYYCNTKIVDLLLQQDQLFGTGVHMCLRSNRSEKLDISKNFSESLLSRMIDQLIPQSFLVDILTGIDVLLFSVPSVLITEWKKSPGQPTKLFVQTWIRLGYDPENTGQYFDCPVYNTKKLDRFPNIKDKICLEPQRGQKWIEFYSQRPKTNGCLCEIRPDMSQDEIIRRRYNLIRGNIAETWVLNYIKHNQTDQGELVQVGMVKDKDHFYSPDGLLVKEDMIIPIEIKTIMGFPCLSPAFLRDYDLARLQLRGVARVLNSGLKKPVAVKGLGYFLFIHFSKTRKNWIYELRMVEYKLID